MSFSAVAAPPSWSTACLDWEERLLAGRSLVPDLPLFPNETERALEIFKRLRIPDVHGCPRMGDAGGPWLFPIVGAIFGSYDRVAHRRMIQEFFWLVPKKNGKAVALDTPIATPNGMTTMGQVAVGDFVMDAEGRATRVLQKSQVFINHPCFEMEFSTGEKIVCDAEHLWVTDAHRDRENLNSRGSRTTPRPSVKTTTSIAASVKVKSGRYEISNHRVAVAGALELPEAILPINPYVLGAWLGDGTTSGTTITCGARDAEEMRVHINDCGQSVRIVAHDNRASSLCLSEPLSARPANGYRFRRTARHLGILGNKHIPPIYLRGSYAQRVALLQGLMDTDGSISAAGQAIYSTSLPSLRDDVVELVSSLGLKASISERRAIFEGRDYGPHWVIQFWPFSEIPVFRLERKRKLLRQRAAKASPRSRTRQIVAVRPVPSVPVQCISVESATKQYLVTRSLIPTHNTSTAAAIMVEALIINDRPEAEFVLVSSTKDLAGRAFKQGKAIIKVDPELDKIFQCQDHLKTITHRRSGAVLQVKAADTDVITGGKQVGTLIDELHVLSERSNASEIMLELRGALTARPDGFVIIITTQSKKPPSGAFKAELLKARAVRDGQLDLPLLPILYELPERLARDNGWMARRYWSLVNPNFGLSVDPTFLERELAAAEDEGKEAMALFASQFFNVEIGVGLHTDRWPGAEYWEAQTDPALTLDALIERCDLVVGGVDGGGLDDLLGICLLGREKDTGRWLIWCHAWAHVIVKERRKSIAARLGDFEKCGDLTFVTSMKQAHEEAADAFEQIDAIGLLGPIGFDPAGASGVEKALAARGIEGDERIRGVRQGYTLSGAVKDAETALSDGDLIHAAQPLLAWCVSNAKIEQTKNGYIVTKQASGWAKIDPLMAMFNAVHLMRDNPESASCYSASRGLVTFA